jgi:predicted transcriptional regulator
MDNNIILKQKQTKILLALKDASQSWYISSLAKASGTTYVHACNFLVACEALGIVSSEKHGKMKMIKLTERGLKIADMITSINSLINLQEPQVPRSTETIKSG